MLTGKDIVNVLGFNTEPASMATYDRIAARLNKTHIAPLQGQIEALQAQNTKLTADIKALRDMDRKIFDEQDKQIAALKALVKDYYAESALMLSIDDPTYEEAKGSKLRLKALQERTENLLKLNEEQESCQD